MVSYVICVFGAGGVGKSCITNQFVQGVFLLKYDPTIEDVYQSTIEVDEKQYSLEILDTAGSEEFSSMRDLYVKRGHGFVLVYSVTSQATFNDLESYYERIISVKEDDGKGPPAIVLVGNKIDLVNERVVSREAGQALAQKWNCSFLEASAKDRASVTEIFRDLVRQINRKSPAVKPIERTPANTTDPEGPSVRFIPTGPTSQSSEQSGKSSCPCCVLL